MLEDRAPAGRRTRFKRHDHLARSVAALERTQGLANRRRVVGEIVNHGHARSHARDLLAPSHAEEVPHSLSDGRLFDAQDLGGPDDTGQVFEVEDTGHAHVQGAHDFACARQPQDRPSPQLPASDFKGPVSVGARATVGRDPTARGACHLHRARRGRANHQMSLGWDERDELAEGILDRGLVGKDVGVVELDRGQNHNLRSVVQEL